MSTYSHIEWTEKTWNPVTGCNKVSAGCKNCYAEKMANRLFHMNNKRYLNNFSLTLHKDIIEQPMSWKKSKIIFVNSMSDLFHEDIPFNFLESVFKTMNSCTQHVFQILTKRSDYLLEVHDKLNWGDNIWMGVSVENNEYYNRIEDLSKTSAHVKFLSCEPLLGPLGDMPLESINWVIVGGESGPKSRPMEKVWVEGIQKQCDRAKVPFFFKQWGGVRKHITGRKLNGNFYNEMPNSISL